MKKKMTKKGGWIMLIMLLALSSIGGWPVGKAYASDEFDSMRENWRVLLTGGEGLDNTDPDIAAAVAKLTTDAQGYWSSMNTSSNRTSLWSNIASTGNSVHIRQTYERLRVMALAYSTEGSGLNGNTVLETDIVQALDYMYATRYHENVTTTPSGTSNWWDWQIGIPLQLNDIVVLMYDSLSPAQIANYAASVEKFTPAVTLTGANRSWKALIVGIRGVLVKDPAKLVATRDGLSQIFDYVTSGDGFYADGSFIQHTRFPYTGGYGLPLIKTMSELLNLLQGTTWQVTDPDLANVWRWVYDAYQPLIYKGAIMDNVRGREISREYSQDHDAGHSAIQSILQLAKVAPPQQAVDFKRMAKAWVAQDTYQSFYESATIPLVSYAKSIAADVSVMPADELLLYKQYSGMDRAVQLRPGYGSGLAMYSSRISTYEAINSENARGWYTSAGVTNLYNGDLGQYSDGYWPTVNSYRLPGTTVLSATGIGNHRSVNHWTGGTEMSGLYGISGMDLTYSGRTLNARKSWFMFDDEIVALGSGITSTDGIAVETIVENRKLSAAGSETLTVNGTAQSSTLGWSDTLTGVQWAHLAGSPPGSDIGYYFPQTADINALREARTGKWSQINTRPGTPSHSITNNYMTMWFNHGANPSAASYEYVLLPNKTSAQVASYAAAPSIEVLANTAEVQAVRDNILGIVGANFWTDGAHEVDFIKSNKKASVMTKESGNGELLELSVSDPTQANTGTIELELDRSAVSYVADPGVTVSQTSPTIKLTVNVNAARGKMFKASFVLGETSTTPNPEPVIVDNLDAGVTMVGTWLVSSARSDRYGANYIHDNKEDKGAKSVTFTTALPLTGTYRVSMMWSEYANRDANIPVDIVHNGGTDTVYINQKDDGGQWNILGTYSFSASGGSVTIRTDGTTGYVLADAVKFEYVP
ncbi:polysaccharide lyase family 8 super-sandwich domain-containing protein [Paenibacillus sp. PL2-23]|uniref:polysaccharide lyase family 8 super-sandwich domain-containing protein n=1 Tax=Paenibacillus sp. PL2-23 TaxID=2100729 RepID=UPI0030FBADD6